MEWRGLNVLITGGAGHIGSHLAARLFALGANVFVADNLWRGRMSNLYLDSRPVIDLDRKFFKLDLVDYSIASLPPATWILYTTLLMFRRYQLCFRKSIVGVQYEPSLEFPDAQGCRCEFRVELHLRWHGMQLPSSKADATRSPTSPRRRCLSSISGIFVWLEQTHGRVRMRTSSRGKITECRHPATAQRIRTPL